MVSGKGRKNQPIRETEEHQVRVQILFVGFTSGLPIGLSPVYPSISSKQNPWRRCRGLEEPPDMLLNRSLGSSFSLSQQSSLTAL